MLRAKNIALKAKVRNTDYNIRHHASVTPGVHSSLNRCTPDLVMVIFPSLYVMSMVCPALKPESRSHLPHSWMTGKKVPGLPWRSNPLLHTVIRLVFASVGIRSYLYSKSRLPLCCILHSNPVFYGLPYSILQDNSVTSRLLNLKFSLCPTIPKLTVKYTRAAM